MLSKMLNRSTMLKKTTLMNLRYKTIGMQRAFSGALTTKTEGESSHLQTSNLPFIAPKSRKEIDNMYDDADAAFLAENKEYENMLHDTSARNQFFNALATPSSSDNSEIKNVKNQIERLIKYEI